MNHNFILIDFLDEVRSGMALATERRANMVATERGEVSFLTLNFQNNHEHIISRMKERGRLAENIEVYNFHEHFYNLPERISNKDKSPELGLVEDGLSHYIDERPNTNGYRYYDKDGNYVKYKLFDEEMRLKFIDYRDLNLQRTHRVEYDLNGRKRREIRYNLQNNKPAFEKYYDINEECYLSVWVNSSGKRTKCVIHAGINKAFNHITDAHVYWVESVLKDYTNPFLMLDELGLLDVFRKVSNDCYKIVTLHNTHLDKPHVKGSPYRRVYKEIFDHRDEFDAIVFLTEEQKRDVEEDYGKDKRFVVVPHAVTLDKDEILDESIERNPKSAITLARLEDSKNIADGIRAFRIVVDTIKEAEYHIFGYGKEKENLQALIKELKLENNVYIHGFTHNVNREIQKHGLSIMTSRFEGFCLVIMESLANQTPVVSYRTKYGPETLIRDGKDGYLTEYNNYEEVAEQVIELMLDSKKQKKFAKNSLDVYKRFSYARYKKNWLGLFKQLSK
ncbi:glycosyltransferase [Bacillus licheniformis]|uniref:glycosyltransferase n=1 Tax=Bacillus TaxID=1386 RepID=UPI001D0EF83B|nr:MULTISPECIES: glycosyltransferase [Bacillus]MCC2134153.1 glycosyltransferase [Bacillus licheniformis]MCC2146489.1 glycosyltransferase [Bacillus licheniformis]MCC2161881.1 glycosyltransferase [Bacillus licheniformis]MCC2187591.1 glycosyltransferase [Bacillus licheniformis]MCX2881281.1 glycosyltransferase [Bacillus sp. AR11]